MNALLQMHPPSPRTQLWKNSAKRQRRQKYTDVVVLGKKVRKHMDFGFTFAFKSHLCHLLAMWSWSHSFISLSLTSPSISIPTLLSSNCYGSLINVTSFFSILFNLFLYQEWKRDQIFDLLKCFSRCPHVLIASACQAVSTMFIIQVANWFLKALWACSVHVR